MGSVRTILASLFTALGGFFLLAMTAGVGFALYVTAAPDSVTSTAEAQTVPSTPLFKPQASISSNSKLIRLASASSEIPFDISSKSSERARVRQLQKALARAECYDGPINGVWSAASKEAMRSFVHSTNAELPVDGPDEALVALIESNDAVMCERGRTIETGSLGSSLQIAAEQAHVEFMASKSAPSPAADSSNSSQAEDSALLRRAWAPAEMLTPSKGNPSELSTTAGTGSSRRTAARRPT
ncbi:MAG: hypothetical protein QM780_17105 [Hyphomicrobium sp.]|uniref:peptidoglycan-binding domain-containing protein n=1 Tax=Hyphomicrobium sp. TaxID=82 RepID=UPI0039E2F9B4